MAKYHVEFDIEGDMTTVGYARGSQVLSYRRIDTGEHGCEHGSFRFIPLPDSAIVEELPEPVEAGWYQNTQTQKVYYFKKAAMLGYTNTYKMDYEHAVMEFIGTMPWTAATAKYYTRMELTPAGIVPVTT